MLQCLSSSCGVCLGKKTEKKRKKKEKKAVDGQHIYTPDLVKDEMNNSCLFLKTSNIKYRNNISVTK